MHHIPDTAPQPDNEPWIVGVTGSIGGGKSTFARALCTQNADIQTFHIDADQLVHDGLKSGGAAVHRVLAAFPCASDGIGGIDRTKLANLVFQDLQADDLQADDLQADDLQADELQASDPQALRRLESILHPIVSEMREQLIKQNRDRSFIVLDVPLLFETETWRRCDLTILVTTDEAVRARRTLARPGMTMARLQAILARQMPDSHKANRVDLIIDSTHSLAECAKAAQIIARHLHQARPKPNDPMAIAMVKRKIKAALTKSGCVS